MGARFNEILGPAAQIPRGLAVTFGIEEQEGATTLSPELQPTFEITARPEFYALIGGSILAGHVSITPTVGQYAEVFASNPTLSKSLIVVEGILVGGGAAATYYQVGLIKNNPPGTAVSPGFVFRDTRKATALNPAVGGITARLETNDVTAQTAITIFLVPRVGATSVTQVSNLNVVLAPGWSLCVRPGVVTVAAEVGFILRERQASERELSGNV